MTAPYQVRESLLAEADYDRIDDFIFMATGNAAATERIVLGLSARVADLAVFPHQGTRRDDILPGLRLLPHGRAVIAFTIDEAARTVLILRLFYGGEDIAEALKRLNDP